MSEERRVTSPPMMPSASSSSSGFSRRRPISSVSTNMRMLVSGVRSSCETLFTKSDWSFASRASR